LSDARDGKFDDFTFLAAALTASGAEDAGEVQKWLGMYEPVRASILSGLPAGTAMDRLKAIHGAAHRFILTGQYESSCSDLRRSFSSGDFNCLTSLAVCWDLCQAAGLNVQPLLVQGHVVLVLHNAKGPPQAFESGSAEWLVHPVGDLSASRQLSPVQLVGKFYYNRGVEELRAGGYRNGLTMLRTTLALDPADDDARANLVAGLNNWAVEECGAGDYEEAASLIEQGLALDPNFGPLISNKQVVQAKLRK
jgi:tetratricopeptide (TPR) repeat protein